MADKEEEGEADDKDDALPDTPELATDFLRVLKFYAAVSNFLATDPSFHVLGLHMNVCISPIHCTCSKDCNRI